MKILSEGSAFQNGCIFDFTYQSLILRHVIPLKIYVILGLKVKREDCLQGESFICSISIVQTFGFVPTTKLGPACIAHKEEDTRLVAG